MSESLVITATELAEQTKQEEAQAEPDQEYRVAELVVFENCKWGIGIKICGGCSIDGEELHGVYVKRILPGGLAETQGGLQKGDQVLTVNGDSLEGVTYERAVSILRLACFTNHVEMVVCRDDQAMEEFEEVANKRSGASVASTPIPQDSKHRDSEVPSATSHPDPSSHQFTNGQEEPLVTPTEGQGSEAMPSMAPHKHRWRELLPTASSTPNHRGSPSNKPGYSTSLGDAELSPVGAPVLSLANALSHSSVFSSHNSLHRQQQTTSHNSKLSRKLSMEPDTRVEMEKLTSALNYLGLETSVEKEMMLRSRLHVDAHDTVRYGDVADVVRDVYMTELASVDLGPNLTFIPGDAGAQPPAYRHEMNGGASGVIPHQSEIDMEELRQENERLKMLLEEKDDEIQAIRKEQREMRSKVHLAAKAQQVARDMEHDYEEVVRLLEGEIAQLKVQLDRQVENDPITQRRLAVLMCQLRKAENEKTTLKVATEKLLQFAESVHDQLGEGASTGATSRPLSGARPLLNRHKPSSKTVKAVASQAQQTVKSVRSLIDGQPLPYGWEETYTADGIKYYINHVNQVTTWTHPLSNVSHLPPPADEKDGADRQTDDTQPKQDSS